MFSLSLRCFDRLSNRTNRICNLKCYCSVTELVEVTFFIKAKVTIKCYRTVATVLHFGYNRPVKELFR